MGNMLRIPEELVFKTSLCNDFGIYWLGAIKSKGLYTNIWQIEGLFFLCIGILFRSECKGLFTMTIANTQCE